MNVVKMIITIYHIALIHDFLLQDRRHVFVVVSAVMLAASARRHAGDVTLDRFRTFSDFQQRNEVVVVHPLGSDPAKSPGVGRRDRRNERKEVWLRKVPGTPGDPAKRHFRIFL